VERRNYFLAQLPDPEVPVQSPAPPFSEQSTAEELPLPPNRDACAY
jgi:hypothetical protein